MGRRDPFISLLKQAARASARAERARHAALRQQQRDARAAEREYSRQLARDAKEAAQFAKEEKQRYLESRQEETDDLNREVTSRVAELGGLLTHSLSVDDRIDFASLRIKDTFPTFKPPQELEKEPASPSEQTFLAEVAEPGFFGRLIPGWQSRYQKAVWEAKSKFQESQRRYALQKADFDKDLDKCLKKYQSEREAFQKNVDARNLEVNALENGYKAGDMDSVITYCSMVLERSEYPDGFPQEFRLAYAPESKELVVEYDLPPFDIAPPIAEFKYIKSKDAIEEKARKAPDIKAIYEDIVVSVCLRTLHELFEADHGSNVEVLTFSGFVQAVDPATGKDIRPCLISVRATKANFSEVNLGRVDKKACLRSLGAQVSPRPNEMVAVRPVVDFNMIDKRFVDQEDVLSELETRPNLMDLNPFEFENLVSNLFSKIGFETKQTRSAKDGGVDAVAFDPRPILGGKVIIQAKRYKNHVGVSAVRDLYGTMVNEGAAKGILVTTSHYGPDAYDFSKNKPIELIDGGGLLYLLEQNGIKARIIIPN